MSGARRNGHSSRRELLRRGAAWTVIAAPIAAYGAWAAVCLRSAWPEESEPLRLPVGPVGRLQSQASIALRTPAGRPITVVRHGSGTTAKDYAARSSRCPHLGCPVRWNGRRHEYECPCHQGRFDAAGLPLAGPPLAAGTPLESYPLIVDDGMLYVLLPAEEAAPGNGTGRRSSPGRAMAARPGTMDGAMVGPRED